jgi:hypothetical protein
MIRSLFVVLVVGGAFVCACDKGTPKDDVRWQNFNKGNQKDRESAQAAFEKHQTEIQKKRENREKKKTLAK